MTYIINNEEFSVQTQGPYIQITNKKKKNETVDFFFILFGGLAPSFIGSLSRFSNALGVYEDFEKALELNSVVEYVNKGLPFPESYGYYTKHIKKELLESLLLVLLLHTLSEVENNSLPSREYLGQENCPFSLLVYLTETVLITKSRVHSANKQKLMDMGFKVSPGEQDGSGWLSGIIHTSKGKLVFG